MKRICVATGDGRSYYSIASRLRRARLPFLSVMPSEAISENCDLILTTRRELSSLTGATLAIEDLDENAAVMKGQILERLIQEEKQELLIGIDPGSRIGFVAFYGGTEVTSETFNSRTTLYKMIFGLVKQIPSSRCSIKIGNGSRELALRLASEIGEELPDAVIEIVNESGTSVRNSRYGRLPKDQSAAVRIALRRGRPYRMI